MHTPRVSGPLFSVSWAAALALLLGSGCSSMEPIPGKPAAGTPMQDVHTEAKIVEMENEYIAQKNSRPSHQYEAEQKAKRKAQEKAEAEKQAKAIQEAEQKSKAASAQ